MEDSVQHFLKVWKNFQRNLRDSYLHEIAVAFGCFNPSHDAEFL